MINFTHGSLLDTAYKLEFETSSNASFCHITMYITSGICDAYLLRNHNEILQQMCDNFVDCDCCNKLVVCQSKPNMNPDKVKDHLIAPDFLIGISSTVIMEIMITVMLLTLYIWMGVTNLTSISPILVVEY